MSTSSAFTTRPWALFLLRFSRTMMNFMIRMPVIAVMLQQLVAIKVGIYDGAYSTRKVAAERTPARLPRPTRTAHSSYQYFYFQRFERSGMECRQELGR